MAKKPLIRTLLTTTVNGGQQYDDCLIEYVFNPGDPGVRTFRNGDPGYPPTPGEAEIQSITIEGKKMDPEASGLSQQEIERLQDECSMAARENIAAEEM